MKYILKLNVSYENILFLNLSIDVFKEKGVISTCYLYILLYVFANFNKLIFEKDIGTLVSLSFPERLEGCSEQSRLVFLCLDDGSYSKDQKVIGVIND